MESWGQGVEEILDDFPLFGKALKRETYLKLCKRMLVDLRRCLTPSKNKIWQSNQFENRGVVVLQMNLRFLASIGRYREEFS